MKHQKDLRKLEIINSEFDGDGLADLRHQQYKEEN